MDPIADMLTCIRNAGNARKETAFVLYSKLTFAIATVLLREGYIASINKKSKKGNKFIEIGIAYDGARPKVHGASRVSKLSRRAYTGFRDIKPVRQGHGDLMLSTPRGIFTGKEARKLKIGGEVLFKIW